MTHAPYLTYDLDSPYYVAFDGHPKNDWNNKFSASLPIELIAEAKKDNYFKITPSSIRKRAEILAENKKINTVKNCLIPRADLKDGDMIVEGKIEDNEIIQSFIKLFFRPIF